MTEARLARARLRKATLIVLIVTVVAFAAALIRRSLDRGSSPALTITYEVLGVVAGIGTAFLVVFVPPYKRQENRTTRRAPNVMNNETSSYEQSPVQHWTPRGDHDRQAVLNREEDSAPTPKGSWRLRSVLWLLLLAPIAWTIVASWGLTFWPSMALFSVYLIGIAIPLGVALGALNRPWWALVGRLLVRPSGRRAQEH